MLVSCDRGVNPPKYYYSCSAGGAAFDGTNDWLKMGSDFSSNADTSQGTFSIWLNYTSGGAVNRVLYANANNTCRIERTAAGKFQATLKDNSGNQLVFTGSTTYGIGVVVPYPQNYVHVIFAWDTNYSAGNKKCAIYMDGVAETLTKVDISPAFVVGYTQTSHGFMADAAGASKWAGSVGCIYFNNSTYMDLAAPANLEKFRYIDDYGNGFPAMMGSNGQYPTGMAPLVFLNNGYDSFQSNRGYGGGLALQGALIPSDPSSPCVLGVAGSTIIPE